MLVLYYIVEHTLGSKPVNVVDIQISTFHQQET